MNKLAVGTARASELNVLQLRTFQTVMVEGGYAAAARVCDLSVASVWQHIQALERTYGVTLFQKVGRIVKPTDAAHRLYQEVEPILVKIESTFELISDSDQTPTIRLVAGARMMMEDLAEPLAQFRNSHPNLLQIRQGNDRRAEELLIEDQADLAMALEPGLKQRSASIQYEPAYTVEFLAVSKPDHPFMNLKAATMKALSKHELVVTLSGTHGRDALDQAFHREGLKANIVAETDNSAFTIACVSSGMGVGILAGRRDGALCKQLATRSLRKQLGQKRIVLMWRKAGS